MKLPPELSYLTALLGRARRKLKDAGDRGAITLEWMVIAALLFAIALAAALKFTSVVRTYMGQLG